MDFIEYSIEIQKRTIFFKMDCLSAQKNLILTPTKNYKHLNQTFTISKNIKVLNLKEMDTHQLYKSNSKPNKVKNRNKYFLFFLFFLKSMAHMCFSRGLS